jgi:hypothetical protein
MAENRGTTQPAGAGAFLVCLMIADCPSNLSCHEAWG